ncbi:helix-turn-helix domain-containing protein [Mycobacteroides chelonae]|uniref:helix-turn-helix domain-containing protein n=1 Tax=Mycobacteroides chelonae TaxID=1774 RepID=UPI001F3EDEF0|nr:helix-turn-helix domain-containing protein [Mycobacteroides chelonae]
MSPPAGTPALERLISELSRQIPLEVLPPVATGKHVAAVLGTSEAALSQERYLHKGIPYTRLGRRVRYLRSDVIEFLAANRVAGAA